MDEHHSWYNGSVWHIVWPYPVYVGQWPIFYGPVILFHRWRTVVYLRLLKRRKLCIKITEYVLHVSHRFNTLDIALYTHVLLWHNISIHTISLKKACAYCPRVLRVGMHMFSTSASRHAATAGRDTCVTTQYWCQTNVNVMDDWSVISADPIEHCSDNLKKRIRKHQLDNVRDLQNAIRREWQRLPLGYIQRLVRYMRRRCDAVFKANGWHTRYWTSKSVTGNDDFDTVKILRVCLLHWNGIFVSLYH